MYLYSKQLTEIVSNEVAQLAHYTTLYQTGNVVPRGCNLGWQSQVNPCC